MESFVWSHIEAIVNDPKRLFEVYKKQSIDDTNYNELLEERKKKERAVQESENKEFTVEQLFLD